MRNWDPRRGVRKLDAQLDMPSWQARLQPFKSESRAGVARGGRDGQHGRFAALWVVGVPLLEINRLAPHRCKQLRPAAAKLAGPPTRRGNRDRTELRARRTRKPAVQAERLGVARSAPLRLAVA